MNFQPIVDFLEKLPEEYLVPGLDCAVAQHHKILFRHTVGLADVESGTKMRPGMLCNLYSVTKVFTATAAMRLWERGAFQLTDPVSKYLPEFSNLTVRTKLPDGTESAPTPAKTPLLIQHLLTMSSGLRIHYPTFETPEFTAEPSSVTTRQVFSTLARNPLAFEPGTRWQYGCSLDLLGALIEVWAGQTFGEYLQTNLFDPLGMPNTGFRRSREIEDRMMSKYRYLPESNSIVNDGKVSGYFSRFPNVDAGGGGLYSCVDDVIRFADAMACGGTSPDGYSVLSSETIDLMRKNRLTPEILPDLSWPHLIGYGYGLGVRTMLDPKKGNARSPIGEFGWNGAAGCYLMIDPENELSVFYQQHLLSIKEPWFQPQLRNLVYDCLNL